MQYAQVPVLGFSAFSGTGKTTLLSQLIPLLKHRGVRVGLIKHAHHNFDVDIPGKDSYRLRHAGASPVVIVSAYRRAVITEFTAEQQPTLNEQLRYIDQSILDLILVEGFKADVFPKIELHRTELDTPLLYPDDPNIIAVASDTPLILPDTVIALDINQPEQVATFILNHCMGNHA